MSASRQRFLTSSGMPLIESDSVIEVRDFPAAAPCLRGCSALGRERRECLGLLERRQILALDVLDQRDLDDSLSSTSRMTIGTSRARPGPPPDSALPAMIWKRDRADG